MPKVYRPVATDELLIYGIVKNPHLETFEKWFRPSLIWKGGKHLIRRFKNHFSTVMQISLIMIRDGNF
jgi:hypothetical protein